MSVADAVNSRGMRIAAAMLVVLCALWPASARAQRDQVPPLITAGLDAYRAAGADSAIAVWFRAAPLDSPESRDTMRRAFDTMHGQAGALSGYDIVKTFAVGSHVRRVFAVLHYDLRPGYLVLDVYQSPVGWTLQNISFNDTAEKVFPGTLLLP